MQNKIPTFRAKDKNGVWHTGLLTYMFKGYAIVNESDENTIYIIDKNTLGQNTSLTDKNNHEIFEGDIVSHNDGEYSYIGVVTQDTITSWWIKGIDPDDNYQFEDIADYSNYTTKLSVRGNIHDNPELLKVGS